MRVSDFIFRALAWEAVRRDLDTHMRDVRAILNGGFALRDQLRVVRDVVIDTGTMPLEIAVPNAARVLGVILVRASLRPDPTGRVISGGAVEWDKAQVAAVRIYSCAALAADTIYDATFAVLE